MKNISRWVRYTSFLFVASGCALPGFDDGEGEEVAIVQSAVTSGPAKIDTGSSNANSPYVADTDFSGGTAIVRTNGITIQDVVNPAPEVVYRSSRSGNSTYTLPGFAQGSSNTIRLHFAETRWTASGQRRFNVSINGTTVLSSFDIFVAAGGANRAVVKEFTMAPNSSGQYVVQFTGVTDSASIAAIEVGPSGRPQGTQVHAGGGALGSFVADVGFSGGTTASTTTAVSNPGVLDAASPLLYQTRRQGNFSYTVPGFVAGSSNTVRLHFAETVKTAAGQRRFNVTINGTQVLSSFDVFAAAGGANRIHVKQFRANADSQGRYVVQFTGVTDQAMVSGIEVARKVPWSVKTNMTAAELQTEFNRRVAAGFRMTYVNGYTVNGTTRFVAKFDLTPGPAFYAEVDMTAADYQQEFNDRLAQGYRLSLVNGYAVGNIEKYAAIWEIKGGGAWSSWAQMTPAVYQQEFDSHLAQGYRLNHVSGYTIAGQEYYAAIWEQRGGPAWAARHSMSQADLDAQVAALGTSGFKLVDLTAFNVGGVDRYAGIWEQGGLPTIAHRGIDTTLFGQRGDDMHRQGYQPKVVTGYAPASGNARHAAIWENVAFSQTDLDRIDTIAKAEIARVNLPSLSLAVTRDGRLMFAKSYGMADTTNETHATSLYRIASISKPVTGVAIMKLVEQGKLSLSSRVFGSTGVLGEIYGTKPYSTNVQNITIRQLASHTAGIQDSADGNIWNQPNWTQAQLIGDTIDKHVAAPGTYEYSNLNYTILGRVIEQLTGQTYENWVKANVLAPSGVTTMSIAGNTVALRKPNEVVYQPSSAYTQNVTRMDAHGGWIASPTDLVRLTSRTDGLLGVGDILSASSVTTMLTPPFPAATSFAIGWNTGPNVQGWNGSITGTRSDLLRSSSLAYAVITNTREGGPNMAGVGTSIINAPIAWPNVDFFESPYFEAP